MIDELEQIINSPSLVRRLWNSSPVARQQVRNFERLFGRRALALACHAAVPSLLTPEVLNLLRINFLDSEQIPYYAEADLLLSPLCREIEPEIYEVEPAVREVLIEKLEEQYGEKRAPHIAQFLRFLLNKKPDLLPLPEVVEAYQWISNAYLNPDETVEKINDEIEKNLSQEANFGQGLDIQIQFVSLVELIASSLEKSADAQKYRQLLNNSRLVSHALYGDPSRLAEQVRSRLPENDTLLGESGKGAISPVVLHWLVQQGIGEENLPETPATEPSSRNELEDRLEPEAIRVYLSHSYRAEDKHINLGIWQLFGELGCYFTVDQKPDDNTPLDPTYLELMMNHCDCFVAIIPKRYEFNKPNGVSRYQLFECHLARKFKKPILIFAEDGLPIDLFPNNKDVLFFNRTQFYEQEDTFRSIVSRFHEDVLLSRRVFAFTARPISLITKPGNTYNADLVKAIKITAHKNGFLFDRFIDPTDPYEYNNTLSIQSQIGNSEIIIAEVNPNYVPLEFFAAIQKLGIPLIPICHLEGKLTEKSGTKSLRLSYTGGAFRDTDDPIGKWPVSLTGYQLDDGIRPVIFWRNEEDLVEELSLRLQKLNGFFGRAELRSITEAKRYFLKIGRRQARVFISNSNSVNSFATRLATKFEEEAIERFHYMDFNAIPVGTENWLTYVQTAIEESEIFVVLMNKLFLESHWCQEELKFALELHKDGRLLIYPYMLEEMDWPLELGLVEGRNISDYPEEKKIEIILSSVVNYMEAPKPILSSLLSFEEIRISYNDQLKRIGISLRDYAYEAEKALDLHTDLMDLARRAIANDKILIDSINVIGETLNRDLFSLPEIVSKYREALEATNFQNSQVRFRFLTDRDGFRIPFEWMKTDESSLPLCLLHPVYRKLIGLSDAQFRPTLNRIEKNEVSILLVASNTGDIPNVDNEIDDLEKFFVETCRLPRENICKLHTTQATKDRIEAEITNGNYHVFHFAGRGSREDPSGAYLQVFASTKLDEIALVYTKEIKTWIDMSDLRFVYMSSNFSAEITGEPNRSASSRKFRRTPSFLEAINEAKVPEIIGFHYPIVDSESRRMALAFYENYFKSFDAANALYETRKQFASSEPLIWAAPLLIQQR